MPAAVPYLEAGSPEVQVFHALGEEGLPLAELKVMHSGQCWLQIVQPLICQGQSVPFQHMACKTSGGTFPVRYMCVPAHRLHTLGKHFDPLGHPAHLIGMPPMRCLHALGCQQAAEHAIMSRSCMAPQG